MTKKLIIVFTRNPELGKVKTRLAKTIGDESALNIYRYLLKHTEKVISKIDSDKAVYYSVSIRTNDLWSNSTYMKFEQDGDDLGQRMLNAFKKAFNDNYDKVLIVGSDLYDLDQNHIENAFNSLDSHDYVLGPAKDGGYYLLGMKFLNPKIFKNKSWGTDSVFKDTMNDLEYETVFLLQELNDIDTYHDIKDNPTLKSFILQND